MSQNVQNQRLDTHFSHAQKALQDVAAKTGTLLAEYQGVNIHPKRLCSAQQKYDDIRCTMVPVSYTHLLKTLRTMLKKLIPHPAAKASEKIFSQ